MKAEKTQKSFLRQHWCLCIYILLAVIGITVPAYMYLKPCEDEISKVVQPADVFILMDASKSLHQVSWQGEKDAAIEFLDQLNDNVTDLQIGFLTFTGHWEGKNERDHPVLRDVTKLGSSFEDVEAAINALPDAKHYLELGTNFHEPLLECKSQLQWFGRKDSYKLCVLMTDGEDMSYSYHGAKWGQCARGCSDPIEASNEVKTFNDTEIMAIYSGHRDGGKQTLFQMSSCLDYDQEVDDCLYFTQVDDFPQLHAKTSNITAKIVESITREHVKCVKGPWLGFLLLLVPLLVMLLLPHCIRCAGGMKKLKKMRIVNEGPLIPPPPPPAAFNQQTGSAPSAPPMEKKIKKAYKWEVDTGKYIRSTGNIRPDWGKDGFVPQSAPTEGPKRKVTVDSGEEADGYEYEYVEVEQTLEEWAEEKMSGAANRFCGACYWFWCCCGMCPCYKERLDDGMEIKLLTTKEALEN